MRAVKLDLERKRRALKGEIRESMSSRRETDDRREMFKDPYGCASLTHDDEVAAVMVDRRARELAQIDRALEDLDAGRYGTCRDCEEPIAEKRLRVMPFATRCVACQARQEDVRRAA
jgi:DnaK suppressor protein